ncbi:DNA-binding transcriptional antiterminator [Marinobacter santoriniensis NKSG1]|uniref:DNA-binding transcriptional antiterminator n=1 Tax=Marinobacter santoriniensis NKSG1 TaxID=1288826 RepID=M7CQP4_9GAMM|nr:transcription/translation regulatory transformer protein RfaH [Marinobacter santoriniensis]EMP55961.1 DNA-binding transcriptional antiterminator [Marinobacter santoriniensis NKSG1]
MTWYALQHRPGQGDRAVQHLQNQNVACFYPKVEVERIRGGRRKVCLEPLFPGYLFVNLEQSDPVWSRLRSTRGVLRVVGFSNKPAPVDDQVISQIKAGLEEIKGLGGIKAGQEVELEAGPFRGLPAVFQSYDGEERALVLITFMQKQQQVSVPAASLRAP